MKTILLKSFTTLLLMLSTCFIAAAEQTALFDDAAQSMLDVAQVAVQFDPSLSSRGSTLNEMSYHSMKTFITHATRKDFRRWITLIVQQNSLTIEVGNDISDPEAQKLIAEMEDGCMVKELFIAYKTIEFCSDQKFEELKKIALQELMETHQRGNKTRAEWPGTVQWLDSVNN